MTRQSLQSLIEQLHDKQSKKRRAAAKRLRDLANSRAADALVEALEREIRDPRTWETQYQMIMALAMCTTHEGTELLERILRLDLQPMVHLAAGDALVRLSRDPDQAVKSALDSGSLYRIEGALRGVAMMRMSLRPSTIEAIVRYASTDENRQVRFWVAAAAAGWRGGHVRRFLESCLRDDQEDTQRAARASLDGTYLKWNPL